MSRHGSYASSNFCKGASCARRSLRPQGHGEGVAPATFLARQATTHAAAFSDPATACMGLPRAPATLLLLDLRRGWSGWDDQSPLVLRPARVRPTSLPDRKCPAHRILIVPLRLLGPWSGRLRGAFLVDAGPSFEATSAASCCSYKGGVREWSEEVGVECLDAQAASRVSVCRQGGSSRTT